MSNKKPAAKKTTKKPAPKNQAKEKKPYISMAELAKKLDVDKSRISRAIEAGILDKSVTKEKRGKGTYYKIDEALALKEWEDNIDPSKQRDTAKAAATREMSSGGDASYKKAKTANEVFKAKLTQMEYQIKAGEYIPAAIVKAECFKISRRVRDSMMAVPERVSAELANMTEPRQISIYLKEQIAAALKDLGDLNAVSTKRP